MKSFTNRLHWFTSNRILDDPYNKKVDFTCKICSKTNKVFFPKFSNLMHHLSLDGHKLFKKWQSLQPTSKEKGISEAILELIKYLVSSYSCMRQIMNKHFLYLLKEEIREKIPSYKFFRYQSLPEVFTILRKFINNQ